MTMKIKTPALILVSSLLIVLISGCLGNGGIQVIDNGDVLDQAFCQSKGLDSQVTVFHSPTCPACLRTVPVLEEIENETDVKFEFIDLTTGDERVKELGITPGHIPAVIIECEVYTGYKTKQQFLDMIF
jgi:thiol-disulfide isomerase/thioredoxin